MLKTALAVVTAAMVGFLALMACAGLSFGISTLTNSGLFGICGPYGSGVWILVSGALLLASPVVGVVAGVRTVRRLRRGDGDRSTS